MKARYAAVIRAAVIEGRWGLAHLVDPAATYPLLQRYERNRPHGDLWLRAWRRTVEHRTPVRLYATLSDETEVNGPWQYIVLTDPYAAVTESLPIPAAAEVTGYGIETPEHRVPVNEDLHELFATHGTMTVTVTVDQRFRPAGRPLGA